MLQPRHATETAYILLILLASAESAYVVEAIIAIIKSGRVITIC